MSAKTASSNKKTSKGGGQRQPALQSIVDKAYSDLPALKEITDLDVLDTMILAALASKMPLKEAPQRSPSKMSLNGAPQ